MKDLSNQRFYDLESLEYVEENEYESHVYAKFAHGSGIVVTSMDNSWGMIVDIIKQLPETRGKKKTVKLFIN